MGPSNAMKMGLQSMFRGQYFSKERDNLIYMGKIQGN